MKKVKKECNGIFSCSYTQTTSRFGILALRKARDSTIVSDPIFLILGHLRSLNLGTFLFAKNQILKLFGYISEQDLIYFGMLLFLVLLGLFVSFLFGIWLNRKTMRCPCPYTGHPLRYAKEIHWMTKEKILRYLYNLHDYNNRIFDLSNAAFSRETGRIFSDATTWYGAIKVDWGFLQKRYPGEFVSWGSLSEEQQVTIMDSHGSLKGFQTEFSSPKSTPRDITRAYALKKPGPLYVDVTSKVLLGWKIVPDTDLEVLIVQKPEEIYIPGMGAGGKA